MKHRQRAVIVDPEVSESAALTSSLAALIDLDVRVVHAPFGRALEAGPPPDANSDIEIALLITSANPVAIQAARASFERTPILALLPNDVAGKAAIEAGADYILPYDASGALFTAVFIAALRVADGWLHTRALESALQSVSDSIEITDIDARILFVNRAFERMTGYQRAEVIGKTAAQLLRSDMHDAHFYGQMWKTVSAGRQWSGNLVGRRKSGTLIAQLATVKPVKDESGAMRRVVAIKQFVPGDLQVDDEVPRDSGDGAGDGATAVTEHVRASITALTNSEQRYRTLVEAAPDAIIIIDFDSAKFLDMNPAATVMFGYPPAEFRQLTPRQLAGPEAKPIMDRMSKSLIETGKAIEDRHPLVRKDGSRLWGSVRLTAYELLGRRQYMAVIRDVTDQVERQEELERSNHQLATAQTQLLHSSRLAALGQMAAGVAHEINNPLHCILAGIDEIEPIAGDDAERQLILADMRTGAERIRSITRSLLPFARVDAHVELIDLNDLIEWSTRLVGNELRHCAQLELRLSPLPPLVGHRARLGELITNLLTNATNAIDEGDSERHRITVTTELGDSPEHVRLIVEDTGRGIPEHLRARVFDPFFTTKADEVGAGLGLALCAEVVARHGGMIDFESTVGRGSRFVVTLRTNAEKRTPPPSAKSKSESASAATTTSRAMRILVIDDEEALMRTYRRALKGLDVVTALGGKAALEILARDIDFDAILCDLMMPSVDGLMVYAFIQENTPSLVPRVVFCTGGAFTPRVRAFLESIPNVVLDKPISATQLRAALAKLTSSSSR